MLQLRDTLSKTTKPFEPINKDMVTMYSCGPTVYDYASIGNFSAYLMADLVKRYLKYLGYKVKHITNITDVGHLTADADVAGEDKLEAAAKKEGIDPYKIAAKYTEQFFADAKAFGVTSDVWPKASDHIPEMIKMIKELISKNHAYIKESGVYFDVTTDPDYGKLSGNTLEQLKVGTRVEVNPDKKHPADFALWKLNQPNHLMQWDSPWGLGYPGWHIECSAMSTKYLGDQIDIHTGGEDNIFPHHECEIAQTEFATGKKPFVRYWLHKQFMTVDGQKMSKSLGNTYRLQDLVDRGFEPEDFRMFVFGADYRSGLNFTWEAMKGARERRLRWREVFRLSSPTGTAAIRGSKKELDSRLRGNDKKWSGNDKEEGGNNNRLLDQLRNFLDDDLNTPAAFALVDEQVKKVNQGQETSLQFWQTVDNNLGLGLAKTEEIDLAIAKKAKELDQAREEKNYSEADRLRQEIIAAGYDVLTGVNGTTIKKK